MHDQFPISIDLAIHPEEMGVMPMSEPPSKGKKSKPIYPSLYISGAKNLEALPREGYALIHFKRRSVTLGDRDGESCCSADLEVHEISLAEAGSDEDSGDMADAFRALAKDRGYDTGSQTDDDDDESEEGESLADDIDETEEK
ncbi:hypothetical protein CCP3SC1_1200006 [Gammaproteobacteria bacterium]